MLAIEPLAIWLRSEERFEGIIRFGQSHKLSLYADDLLLYISNPMSSFPIILNILETFSTQSLFPFRKVMEGFRYLGIFIAKSFTELFAKNFRPLLDRCKSELARWSSLPLSLMGHVNLIKMVVLPQFLYTFQHIPIFINKSFFSTLDQQINSFLWCNKQARIRRKVLQLPKSKGGLALPNLRHYYWACNINKVLFGTIV